jgi:DNA-directed RNA polymerase specialized sigma24 family protein
MTRRRKLTDEQIEDLCRRREQGWSYRRLADQFGVTRGAVHYHTLRQGAVSPRQVCRPTPTEPHAFVAGDGRTQRRFTQAEDALLLALEGEGLNYNEIARRCGRARTSVRIRLMTLALRDEIAERTR